MSENVITSYKGFDKNMKCRGFQYEVGKEYEMDGEIKCCKQGFHACKSPMEVWDYYDMISSRYAEVEQSSKIEKEENSTKVCSSRIKIKAELKLADIINIGVEWLKDITSPSKVKADGVLNDNGYRKKQIGSSGYSAQIGSSGYSDKAHYELQTALNIALEGKGLSDQEKELLSVDFATGPEEAVERVADGSRNDEHTSAWDSSIRDCRIFEVYRMTGEQIREYFNL